MHCKAGDKPTVKYWFQGQSQKEYRSEFSPIDIITKEVPIDASANYSNEGFVARFRADPCTNGYQCAALWKDFEIYHPNPGVPPIVFYIPCGDTSWSRANDGSRNYFILNRGRWDTENWVLVDTSQKCPQTVNKRCSIQVRYNGLVIFQDQGNCPITYSVSCGNCPNGQEEHRISKYPGYCCMDCSVIKNEIKSIASVLKRNRRG